MFSHSHKIRKLPPMLAEFYAGLEYECAIAGCSHPPTHNVMVQKLVAFGKSVPRTYKLCSEHAKMFAVKHSLEVA